MSYCRWSSDNYKSDVYAYGSIYGGFEVHVASARYVPEPPPLVDMTTATPEEVIKLICQRSDALEKAELVSIGGEYDGKSFSYDTLEEFLNGLLDIQAHGYHVPQHAFDRIREEISCSTSV